jgi:poly(3-hydroxybutyrate) depolymerase
MRAGTRVCAAILAALATLSTAGCTISNAIADAGHQPASAPTTAAPKPKPKPSPTATKTMKSLPTGTRHLSVDGRSFLLYVPPHPRQPAPLVVFLGGIGSTAKSEVSIFRGTGVAKRSGAVVAYPSPSTS